MGRYDHIAWLKRPKSYTNEELDMLPREERIQIERQWRNYNDIKNSLDTARWQGLVEGLKECSARLLDERQNAEKLAIANGKELPSVEMDNRFLYVAKRLLLLGVSVQDVSQCTSLSADFLCKMRDKEWAEAVRCAKSMLAKGISVEDVSDFTGLAEWEVVRMARE